MKSPRLVIACMAVLVAASDAQAADTRIRFKTAQVNLQPFREAAEHPTHTEEQRVAPKAPTQFNPDPGQSDVPAVAQPTPPPSNPGTVVTPVVPAAPEPAPLSPDYNILFPPESPVEAAAVFSDQPLFGSEPLPDDLKLPRKRVRGRLPIDKTWDYPEYPLGREGLGFPPHHQAVPNRWFLNFPQWRRYHDPSIETPYAYETPRLWHPYEQSTLKGDVPIIGEDLFLNLTAKNFSLFEFRQLPVASGVSTAQPNSAEFFGRGQQWFISNDSSFTAEFFKGETAFKPVNWALRVTGVYNNTWLWVRENGLVDPDPRGPKYPEPQGPPDGNRIGAIPSDGHNVNPKPGQPSPFPQVVNPGDVFNYLAPEFKPTGDADPLVKVDPETNEPGDGEKKKKQKQYTRDFENSRYTRRHTDFFALQEAFAEIHFSDLSDTYDFISSRTGIQPFVSDFRGFIFNDTNLGFRAFGNLDNNRVQYNLAFFNMREKDTYSDLNTFDSRHQKVLIANVYRQDFIWKGYTTQFSYHANFDDGGTHYDKNGFLTRPALLGTVLDDGGFFGSDGSVRGKDVRAHYLGWTGDGHIGRLNITHAFYQVFGEDEFNGLAGRRVDINAQMAALELSYDRDWIRFKLSGFYASGDSNPTDRVARGFDTILDNPFFIGGPFSWYVHEGINLAGTAVNLKQRDSLVPNLRSSKTEGQSNFVNPGVMIVGLGSDLDITPRLRGFVNANYIWLAETKPIEVALQTNKVRTELGLDTSIGFKYRPLLTDNILISAGIGLFFPGAGYRDIYRSSTKSVPGFGPSEEGKVDRCLYNGFLTVTFVY
ncbi:hypothetical protein ACXR0O_04880 [Verrucomicrobiota bacterium sgz303538]